MSMHEPPPIPFTVPAAEVQYTVPPVPLPQDLLDALIETGIAITTDEEACAAQSRDWWPISLVWALDQRSLARAGAILHPTSTEEVSTILRLCNEHRVPVVAAGGRSGVSGGAVPARGGVLLDLTRLSGIIELDTTSLTVEVRAGTFGDELEQTLQEKHGVTIGHWPQSMALATVGGWVACRGAGQLSTRYGKIEDIVEGLEVVLASGEIIRTGVGPRAATGPDLTQLFVGSEGTLGIITAVRFRLHPKPPAIQQAAYSFPSVAAGIAACRRILQRGATPAVLRLYDHIEGERNFQLGERTPLLVRDEGDPALIATVMEIVAEECAAAEPLDAAVVDRWVQHRNDVSALEHNIRNGAVVDTMEIAVDWKHADEVYEAACAAIGAITGTVVVSAHLSHSYTSGCCLYFTFGGLVDGAQREDYYKKVWDAGQRAVLRAGGNLSHHHGVGMNRARFMPEALGASLRVFQSIKTALDPNDILNPGKLGLGQSAW